MIRKLAIKLTVAFLAAPALMADTEIVNGIEWTYTVNNGVVMIESVPGSTAGNVVIPSTLGGYKVTEIGNRAFQGRVGIRSITIPNTVTRINEGSFYRYYHGRGYGAFCGCIGLTSIVIPNSVTNIGEYAFGECSALTSLTIGNGVRNISGGAFAWCDNLKKVVIPDSVVTMGDAFYSCEGLRSIVIPNSVITIGGSAFGYCGSLSNVCIPASVSRIEEAFVGCNNLRNVEIPQSVCQAGFKKVFGDNNSVTNVVILSGTESIKDDAFNGCVGIRGVTLPYGVTDIGKNAFAGCGITSITIPGSVQHIWESAFAGCWNLSSVTMPSHLKGEIDSSVFSGCADNLEIRYFDAKYVVTFDANGGTASESRRTVKGGNMLGALPTVVRDGYRLDGWFTALKEGSLVTARTVVSASVTYYARWTAEVKPGTPNPDVDSSEDGGVRYNIASAVADRTIAEVSVNGTLTIPDFTIRNGKVYDCVVYAKNKTSKDARVVLPSGYTYVGLAGCNPLVIPAGTQNLLTITRIANRTFLVSREELENLQ